MFICLGAGFFVVGCVLSSTKFKFLFDYIIDFRSFKYFFYLIFIIDIIHKVDVPSLFLYIDRD